MIVNHDKRFVFVAVPRTGSMSISRALLEIDGSFEIKPHHNTDMLEECREYEIVATVRHPFDRLRALWGGYQNCQAKAIRANKPHLTIYSNFREWLESLNGNGAALSITDFLGDVNPTLVIRYEDITNSRLPMSLFGVVDIPCLGENPSELCQEDEYFDTVYEYHRADFDNYEYSQYTYREQKPRVVRGLFTGRFKNRQDCASDGVKPKS